MIIQSCQLYTVWTRRTGNDPIVGPVPFLGKTVIFPLVCKKLERTNERNKEEEEKQEKRREEGKEEGEELEQQAYELARSSSSVGEIVARPLQRTFSSVYCLFV